ncbi:allantoate amidohydrolase [Oxalicibacterium faecigallinarum]|uniref:Zn-dependent hydrolase n=1 Tax=Oxalicibacterium faecigallinarum TaxID=573741 RepID=A0A8J3AUK7_9BURK|nr:allantoate amidohydrolase [Oxalicibacterium faecigallinarum]GGI19102.1 Zn-dependent hydrolase [Oxalicibacterium faecigallinarum]
MPSTLNAPTTTTAQEIMERLHLLAQHTEQEGMMTRTYLTAAHRGAAGQIAAWMRDAGMTVRRDAVGNVIGRYEGTEEGRAVLMTGSHFDTVRNGGIYDGLLGIILPISCVAAWHRAGKRFPFPIEIVAFSEEEGVRFKAPMLGSRAIAGTFQHAVLNNTDEQGISMRDAMQAADFDPAKISAAAAPKDSIAAFIEVHIEQGPVLLNEGLPLGIVTAISGASRFMLELEGLAGHAGTVPMNIRHDAAMAAAELALFIEQRCSNVDGLVGTIGQWQVPNGATNVIPGRCTLSLDVRAGDDAIRLAAVNDIETELARICSKRGVRSKLTKTYETTSATCAPWLQDGWRTAMALNNCTPRLLPSGAGHDAMAIATIAPMAMLFVRCGNGGISHNPAETMTTEDAGIAADVFMDFVENFDAVAAKASASN